MRQDYGEAVEWHSKGAKQTFVDAQANLGYRFPEGSGATRDYAEAVKWYLAAAEQGDATSQYMNGYHYTNGLGVNQDLVQAYAWFRLAELQVYVLASDARESVSQLMTFSLFKQAQGLANEWIKKSTSNQANSH